LSQPLALADLIDGILSQPREAGTPAAERARQSIAEHLASLGYQVEFQRFTFSPASLTGFPIFGAGLGGLALLLVPLLSSSELSPWLALAVWLIGLAALITVAVGIGLGWVALAGVREDANLVASRTGIRPRRWIVAHLDTKAQRQSMAGRMVTVWVLALAILAVSALVLARLAGPISPAWLGLATALSIGAGILAGRGRLQGSSPGARDNGSGMVAALAAAAAIQDPEIGILITGAEEFGLVGSRVFGKLRANLGQLEFINLDTVDDEGKLYVVSHDARGQRLGRSLEPSLTGLGLPVQHRRLPWGILVDSAPLARGGGSAITLGRLTWATLRRIHTPADTADGLAFETAKRLGKALASN
jgi:hypothetical protein